MGVPLRQHRLLFLHSPNKQRARLKKIIRTLRVTCTSPTTFKPFLHLFHHPQVNFWTFSILIFALDPSCQVLHPKHQFWGVWTLGWAKKAKLPYHKGIMQFKPFLHLFHHPQVNFWTFSILIFALDPSC